MNIFFVFTAYYTRRENIFCLEDILSDETWNVHPQYKRQGAVCVKNHHILSN